MGHGTAAAVAVAWLAFVFQFLLLLVRAAAAGRIGIGRRSPELLAFGFFHFLLDGLDVQLAFRRCCNGNGRGVIAALRFGSIQHIGFAHWRCEGFGWVTFSRLLQQRLLFRRDEGFVPLFLLLGLRLNLFGLGTKQKKLNKCYSRPKSLHPFSPNHKYSLTVFQHKCPRETII